jgi:two-component system chemotaxis response regulator CheY/two-component system phosphate regulon response regulator PhoB
MLIGVQKAVVVEDNPRFRELVKIVLGSLGITEVAEAKDGNDAIAVLETFDADIVIMDWTMGGMDGVTCTQHIRSGALGCDPDLPIVMLSGHGGDDAIRHAREAGVDVYLIKPISLRALHDGIQRALGRSDRPREAAGSVMAVSPCAA